MIYWKNFLFGFSSLFTSVFSAILLVLLLHCSAYQLYTMGSCTKILVWCILFPKVVDALLKTSMRPFFPTLVIFWSWENWPYTQKFTSSRLSIQSWLYIGKISIKMIKCVIIYPKGVFYKLKNYPLIAYGNDYFTHVCFNSCVDSLLTRAHLFLTPLTAHFTTTSDWSNTDQMLTHSYWPIFDFLR
jgi:hypothetical protein